MANPAKSRRVPSFVARLVERFRPCPHDLVRCVHGDEIIFAAGFKRRCCLDCGRYLDGPLPEPCSVTGNPHGGLQRLHDDIVVNRGGPKPQQPRGFA